MADNLELRGNTWYYRGVIGGKLKRVSTGYHDKERARRRAREIEGEIRDKGNGWVKKIIPEFGSYAIDVLDARYRNNKVVRTLMSRPIKLWSAERLDSLTHRMMMKYFEDRKAAGAAPGTLEYERQALKTIFRMAIDEGFKIERNPMNGIKLFKGEPMTRVVSFDEEAKLREHLKTRPMWDWFLTAAFGTGLRSGELRGFAPCDVIKENGGMWLRVTPWTNKKRKVRLVPLRQDVITALDQARDTEFRAQAHKQPKIKFLTDPDKGYKTGADVPENELPFFPFSGPVTIIRALDRFCTAVNIADPFGAHALRRTFATRCATTEPPMYPKHLQLIMGHEKIDTTMKFYVHLERASLVESIGRMKLFNQ